MANQLNVLKEPLLGSRERFNTLFALAKRARPRLQEERFRHNLARFAVPLVAEAGCQDAEPLVSALYEVILELTGLELFERSDAVKLLWTDLLPAAIPLISSSPNQVIPRLTNAAYNLERESGADWVFWLKEMARCCPRCETAKQWMQAGQILSWVSGMAHFRESVLELAEELPPELVESLVPRWDRVKKDPWWSRRPQPGQVSKVHRLGAFVGYGGQFRKPPELVVAGPSQFLVSDGTDDWLLSCDGFGATLKRVFEFQMISVKQSELTLTTKGDIQWLGKKFSFPELGPVASYDVSGSVLACTSLLSHHIHIFLASDEE